MNTQFTPMSHHTVQFAKDYRSEQIRAAEQSRTASMFTGPRRAARRQRARAAWHAAVARFRHQQPATEPVQQSAHAAR